MFIVLLSYGLSISGKKDLVLSIHHCVLSTVHGAYYRNDDNLLVVE